MGPLSIADLLASCPRRPTRLLLPLPNSVSMSHVDVFIEPSIINEFFSSDTGQYSFLTKSFPLYTPALYEELSGDDLLIAHSPLATAQVRKPNGGPTGERHPTHHHHQSHHYTRKPSEDLSEFVTQKGNGRRFQARLNHGFNQRSTPDTQRGNYMHDKNPGGYSHDRARKSYSQQRQKKTMDSFVSQSESLQNKHQELLDDPWSDSSLSIGTFDSSGNFILPEQKKDSVVIPTKIPVHQSRLSAIISSKIIPVENLEATLLKNCEKDESNVSVPFFNLWYYKDPSGVIQGPFPAEQMAHWSDAGYFDVRMLVRPELDSATHKNGTIGSLEIISHFVPLSEWISLYNSHLPWSTHAQNIVYSVKLPSSSWTNGQPISPVTTISAKTLTSPSVTADYSGMLNDLLQDFVKKTHINEDEKPPLAETSCNVPLTVQHDSVQSVSQNTPRASSSSTHLKEGSEQGIRSTIITKPATWSSVVGHGKNNLKPEPKQNNPIHTNLGNTQALSTTTTPIISGKPHEETVASTPPPHLVTWVSQELARLRIQNVDPFTLTSLLLPLQLNEMRDVLSGVIPNSTDSNRFISAFNRISKLDSDIETSLTVKAPTVIKTSTGEAAQKSHGDEDDGFSVVTRKPKKSQHSKSVSPDPPAIKRIVGL